MTYAIRFARRAHKELLRLSEEMRRRMKDALLSLATNPFPTGSKKLGGDNPLHRIRIGDYRIVYVVEKQIRIITIIHIGHRKDVYRKI